MASPPDAAPSSCAQPWRAVRVLRRSGLAGPGKNRGRGSGRFCSEPRQDVRTVLLPIPLDSCAATSGVPHLAGFAAMCAGDNTSRTHRPKATVVWHPQPEIMRGWYDSPPGKWRAEGSRRAASGLGIHARKTPDRREADRGRRGEAVMAWCRPWLRVLWDASCAPAGGVISRVRPGGAARGCGADVGAGGSGGPHSATTGAGGMTGLRPAPSLVHP